MSSPGAKVPNLFIVGAPKCGTTAWAEYLGSHPDIFFPPYKDNCYFAHDLPNFRLVRSAADYAAQFVECDHARIVGEASAMYLFSKTAAAAIRDHNRDARILIFLRAQEEYLPALHNQFLREFAEEIQDFETAWRLSGQRPKKTVPAGCLEPRTLDYKAMGRFAEQVERYLTAFPAEQVRVVRFGDWTANPRQTYCAILDFLGLEDDGRTSFPPVNPGASYRSRRLARWVLRASPILRRAGRLMRALPFGDRLYRLARSAALSARPGYGSAPDPALREEVIRYYAEDNHRLEALLKAAGLAST